MIIAFTGHRPKTLGGYDIPNPTYNKVRKGITDLLKSLKPKKVISGMALGVDQWAAEICIELGIPFIAAIPFMGQERRWPDDSRKTYHKLLAKAEQIEIVSEGIYNPEKMQIRNEWMVDNSDALIAVYNGSDTGGTVNCIRYAKGLNKKIYYISP